nr:RNA-directed DNA polymerase, eukaryota [Tanacetum cinerariifolium]
MAYILVNGSPTEEFKFYRGLSGSWIEACFKDICRGKSKVISVAKKMSQAGWNSSFRRMHRGGIESSQSEELVRILGSAILSSAEDRWRWSPLVPIKVNVLAWRLAINKLATRVNMYNRWIKVNSMLCEVCDTGIESTYHLFFGYELAKDLMVEVGNWWSLDIPSIDYFLNLQVWFQSLNMSKVKRDRLEVVFLTLWWHVWNFRNASLFAKKKPKRSLCMDNIVNYALLWINGRSRNQKDKRMLLICFASCCRDKNLRIVCFIVIFVVLFSPGLIWGCIIGVKIDGSDFVDRDFSLVLVR